MTEYDPKAKYLEQPWHTATTLRALAREQDMLITQLYAERDAAHAALTALRENCMAMLMNIRSISTPHSHVVARIDVALAFLRRAIAVPKEET